MSDVIAKSDTADDGNNVTKNVDVTDEAKSDTDAKETKPRTVSFNRDVHVKRFGKPRESRGASSDPPSIRKEPFTHLSEKELIDEANRVLAQAQSVTCTADHPPEKFFSLPHRKKFKEDKSARRNSDDSGTPEAKRKSNLGRSTSDVTSKRKRERTSLSTLFRRAQRTKSPDSTPVAVTTRPVAIVKRSKSDVTDLKSKQTNTLAGTQPKPKRKRSGSESEEFLKSLRNTKTQLSPIIESSPREDYFQKISPLDLLQKQNLIKEDKTKVIDSNKVNPVEKPPRYKTPEKSEPKAPLRSKRGKSTDKEKSPSITETPKRITEIKKKILVDEINSGKIKEKSLEVKDKIKDKIRKIEENVYGTKDMIHSSQQPPDKPPLTRGHTVDHIVRILKEDQQTQPVNPHLMSSSTGININQPFSYTRPSTSPDPNLFLRNTSPDRVPTPVNTMDKGVVYAQVVRDRSNGTSKFGKENMHKTYSPPKEKYGNLSDEDEGLGYEERYKYTNDYKNNGIENFESLEGYKITDSPIKPKFREYKLTSFKDFEPTYANEYPTKEDHSQDYINACRGRADGMDTKKKPFEAEVPKVDLDFNELSHRRELLESRLNARRIGRERNVGEPISRYLAETDPIYEAQKRMKATEKYVNEITSKYYSHTLERDGFTESTVTENYNKYDSDNNNIKYNTETRTVHKTPKGEVDRREFINHLEVKPRYTEDGKVFPPEPEYEPPSLEFNTGKPILSPDEYKEKKYKVKKNFISSHDVLQTGQKYKVKDTWFGKRKGHYASNPEIAQKREDDIYANLPYHSKQPESYHNSLRRRSKERRYKDDVGIHRHDSGDSRDYYRENMSPRRFEIDNRLVDSGIENDFRKESNGDIRRSKHRRHDSYEDARDTSLFLDSERRHTEDNYPSEQIYANGGDMARFENYRHDMRKDYTLRDKSADDGSHFDTKIDRYEKSPNGRNEKIMAKPPKAKKLSGLEKMKQLFSRDSSKKSKKEDAVQPKTRTRVLKSPEHLTTDDHEYKRFTDPEPSDIEVVKKVYEPKEERRYRNSREELDLQRSSDPRDIDPARKYRDSEYDGRYERTVKEVRRHVDRKEEKRRYHSSDRESDHQSSRPSDVESDLRKSRSRTARPLDSPTLADRYRGRRRLATPSPTPSPPLRKSTPASSGGWFKSLDRLGRKREKSLKTEKESVITTDNESIRKTKQLNSPPKNLRFFGDTDQDSDATVKQTVTKTKSHPQPKSRGTVRKTLSNSSTGIDEIDHSELPAKSYSLSNLHREGKSDSPKNKQYYKRNLHNISEIQSNSETESHIDRKVQMKPPISPYDRRSRSHSSSKTLKGKDVRRPRTEDRGSSSELRSSRQELSRESKGRRRTPVTNSAESSTEGDSSHQSQRSVVYLHATTVGDIPDPGRVSRNRSRDDVSSVNSSNLQIKTTTKSFSIFAPWTPKHYEQQDVHYAQKPRKAKETSFIKSSRNSADERPSTLQKNRSYSQTTLNRRPVNNRLTSSSTTLYRKPEKRENSAAPSTLSRRTMTRDAKKSQSNEVSSRKDDKVSRSISMPKDNNKKAGWFKLSNKNKKTELDTRVR